MDDEKYLELLKRGKELVPKTEAKGRFEIPEAIVQVQGRQTFIKNFKDIAKALRRDPDHVAKFLFIELAVPGSLGNELLVQGKFSKDIINRKIEMYVKEFVLCEECGKPDSSLIKTDRLYTFKCEACGARRPVRKIK